MMTIRLSDEHLRAWLDCEFCGTTYEYPFQARYQWKLDPSRKAPIPTMEHAIRAHYYLNERGSFKFAPCPSRSKWRDTDCQLIDLDSGDVYQTGRVRFEQLYHAGKVRGETLVVTVT